MRANGLTSVHANSSDQSNNCLQRTQFAMNTVHCLQDRKLQLYSFQGIKTREWVMDSVIRSAACIYYSPSYMHHPQSCVSISSPLLHGDHTYLPTLQNDKCVAQTVRLAMTLADLKLLSLPFRPIWLHADTSRWLGVQLGGRDCCWG